MSRRYQPPFTVTAKIVSKVAAVAEGIGRMSAAGAPGVRLRRINRIRTIRGSLAIEGNTLSGAQITAILDGKPVIASPRREAIAATSAPETPVKTRVKPADELLLLLRRQPTLTLAEAAALLSKSTSAIERMARKLRDAGRVRHVGPQKGGHWEVAP